MNALRHTLRRSTWLALVAALAMALVPTLSHAWTFAKGGTSAWAEVCTPQGMKLVAIDDASAEDAAASTAAMGMDHCPFCVLSAGAPGLPPAPTAVPLMPDSADAVPILFLHAPRTLFAWAAAQPRAPPVKS